MTKSGIIADDDASLRGGLARFLRGAVTDAKIDEVSDGESLVQKVLGGGYSLVITDYDMGRGMTGVSAIRAIRASAATTPIFMLSGSDKREEALEAGATGYFPKNSRDITTLLKEVAQKYLN